MNTGQMSFDLPNEKRLDLRFQVSFLCFLMKLNFSFKLELKVFYVDIENKSYFRTDNTIFYLQLKN